MLRFSRFAGRCARSLAALAVFALAQTSASAAPPDPRATPLIIVTPAVMPLSAPTAGATAVPGGGGTLYRPWDLVCGGTDLARFSNATVPVPVVTVNHGAPGGPAVTTPGSSKPVIVTLTAGTEIGNELETWYQMNRGTSKSARNCTLTDTTAQGVVAAKWALTGAVPTQLSTSGSKTPNKPISELQLSVQMASHG